MLNSWNDWVGELGLGLAATDAKGNFYFSHFRIQTFTSDFTKFTATYVRVFFTTVSVQGHLQSTWSHGMQTFSSTWIVGRTQVPRKTGPETCSLDSGFQTCSCAVWRRMKTGRWCVLTSVLVSLRSGARSLKLSTNSKWNSEMLDVCCQLILMYCHSYLQLS